MKTITIIINDNHDKKSNGNEMWEGIDKLRNEIDKLEEMMERQEK